MITLPHSNILNTACGLPDRGATTIILRAKKFGSYCHFSKNLCGKAII
ncbi:16028_t:CDS:2 [Funneliformis caledonium]|uniref:16028_t:CDS:1 n=1 Tax=Funneliformis caledonium TaxID=1117310 RepID=A0A9N8V0B7_9GLOM|nr:16028_t:CDS:2 [Funneliformis caledonium]